MNMERTTGGVIGNCAPDNLVADIFPPPDVFTIELKDGAKPIARGTVMAREKDGKFSVMKGEETGTASCIIAETTIEGDTKAVAYRSGNFNRNALITEGDYELSADDESNLREAGIFLRDSL